MTLAEQLFHQGADAVAHYWPKLPRNYRCPLCGVGFIHGAISARVLTLEHAPPKSMGGKAIALTCYECNARAGQLLNPHSVAAERELEFQTGRLQERHRARLFSDELEVVVDLEQEGDTVRVYGLRKFSRPDHFDEWVRRFDEQIRNGTFNRQQFQVQLKHRHPYKRRSGHLDWLRSAYLVAFAALGYRYAFDPALAEVRAQLADPTQNQLAVFSITDPDADPRVRSIAIVEEPAELQSLLVQMDDTRYFCRG